MLIGRLYSISDPDYYKVLNIPKNAPLAEIKKAYRRKALSMHPDRNINFDTTKDFQGLLKAYNTLSEESKRRAYDAYLKEKIISPKQAALADVVTATVLSAAVTGLIEYTAEALRSSTYVYSLSGEAKSSNASNEMFFLQKVYANGVELRHGAVA